MNNIHTVQDIPKIGHANSYCAKIIVPRNNKRDALSSETFIQSICTHHLNDFISLEIYADYHGTSLLVRAKEYDRLTHAVDLVKATWPQCDVRYYDTEQDPAVKIRESANKHICLYEGKLRSPAIWPIRTSSTREGRSTYDDFSRGADPLMNVISTISHLNQDQQCLIQYILSPMPYHWASFWRGTTQDVNEKLKLSPVYLISTLSTLIGVGFIFFALLICLPLVLLFGLTNYAFIGLGCFIAALFFFSIRLKLGSPPDPHLVQQKIAGNAYRVWFRIYTVASDRVHAENLAIKVTNTFSAYNFASGNGFMFKKSRAIYAPDYICFKRHAIDQSIPSLVIALPGSLQKPILSSNEMAILWHLPHEASYNPSLEYGTSKQVMAPRREFGHEEGMLCGYVPGIYRRPVYLSPQSILRGNIGLVATTQSGKSNMMCLIAQYIMENDPQASVIVIDPHRTLAQHVASLVPKERITQAVFLDLSTQHHSFGMNLIEPASYESENALPDKRVMDTLEAMRSIWSENWGPRTEDYARGALDTLFYANRVLMNEYNFRSCCDKFYGFFLRYQSIILNPAPDHLPSDFIEELKELCTTVCNNIHPPASEISKEAFNQISDIAYSILNTINRNGEYHKILINKIYTLYNHIVGFIDNTSISSNAFEEAYRSRLINRGDGHFYPHLFTLLDVPGILSIPTFTRTVLDLLSDASYSHLRTWWLRNVFDFIRVHNTRALQEFVTPINTKINSFNALPQARRVFGQTTSTLQIKNIIDSGGILIVDLAAGIIGSSTAALIGATLINWLSYLLFHRQEKLNGKKYPRVYLIIDEFQSIHGANLALLLSEMSKYGAHIIMGTQSLSNIENRKNNSKLPWLENIHTLFVFNCGAEDSKVLSQELNVAGGDDFQNLHPSDIVGLPRFHCYVRARDLNGIPRVFLLETRKAPQGDENTFNIIYQNSIMHYMRTAEEADAMSYATYERHLRAMPQGAAYDVNSKRTVSVENEGKSETIDDPFFSHPSRK
ncbi:MAG: DUF87 domain-containing protein [Methylacidiphilales bacterium]|nr:DUF87 domain-containing protein [Candidatus Methylacidiphilales bacterium]